MTDPLLEQDDASTPLTPDERAELILSYITQRRELNEAEQANIVEAELWALTRKRDVLSERFLRQLHKRRTPKAFFDYVDHGSYSEQTYRANTDDLQKLHFRQRILRDISVRDQSTTILGEKAKIGAVLACALALATGAVLFGEPDVYDADVLEIGSGVHGDAERLAAGRIEREQ